MKTRAGLYAGQRRDWKGRRVYCGPFALQVATGKDLFEICLAINAVRKKPDLKHIGSTSVSELRGGLERLSVRSRATYTERGAKPTLTQWRRETARKDRTYVVLITNHWVTVRGDWLVDTWHEDGYDLSRPGGKWARKRIQAWIELF